MHLMSGWAYLASVRSDRNVFSATDVIDQPQPPLNLAWATTGFSTRALPSKRQRVTKDCWDEGPLGRASGWVTYRDSHSA
jgi:hypothetical protein